MLRNCRQYTILEKKNKYLRLIFRRKNNFCRKMYGILTICPKKQTINNVICHKFKENLTFA